MISIGEFRKAQRSEGPATILAIGTANPPNCVLQSTYADYYFRVTESEHKKDLKEKFGRMCDNSTIKKRYMVLTEEILKERPSFLASQAPSLDEKQDISVVEIPKLGAKAAKQAIKEWGQPMSKITHLVVCSTTGVDTPGADFQLVKLLSLSPSVKRMMLYQQGCFAGGSALRFAKDLAENNKGARVLIVASEITVALFHGPDEKYKDSLVGQTILGDGAAAIIVGSDPLPGVEKPIFELLSAAQTILPDSEIAIKGRLGETGLMFSLKKDIPPLIQEHDIEKCLVEAFEPLGIHDWNSIFWCAHPGSRKILDAVKEKLSLNPTKLWASRKVLSDYGNMSSASVLFVLNEMRNYSATNGFETTGEGLEWGVLMSFGPGFTIETIVLHSVSI